MDEWSWLVFTQSCQPHHHTSCIKQLGSETVDHRVNLRVKECANHFIFSATVAPGVKVVSLVCGLLFLVGAQPRIVYSIFVDKKKYLNISKYHGCLLKQGRCESRIDNIISKVERTISKVQLTMEIFEKFLFSKKYQENIFLVKSLIH